MSKRGRKKSSVNALLQKNAILNYFSPENSQTEASGVVKDLIDYLISQSVVDSYEISHEIVSGILEKVFDRVQHLTAHSGDRVSKKTIRDWFEKYPWLIINEESGHKKLCCRICKEHKTTLQLSNVWAHEGSPSIQISSLLRHNESYEHKTASRTAEKSENKRKLETPCDGESDSNVLVTDEDLKLFRTVYFTAKSELPSETINGLLRLQLMNGLNIQYKNLSWDTITEIQRSLCYVLKANLINEIKESEYFGLLIDESTDLTVEKRLSICVNFVKSGEAVTKFLCNVPIDDGRATTLVNCVVKTIEDLGLSLSSCVSLSTDGAPVMLGKKNGVGVQVQAKYAPFCIQTHCVAHRLNLACTDTIKKDPYMVKFKDKFNSLYFFMSGSSLRTTTLKRIQAILEEPAISIKEPHSIRWLGLKNAVEAVFASYSSVLATLAKFTEDKNSSAKGLQKYFNSYKVALVTAFMLDVHTELAILSCQLQKQNLLFSEIHPLVQGTIAKIDSFNCVDGEALTQMKEKLSVENGEATMNGEKIGYNGSMNNEFESLRTGYIKHMKKNLGERFKKKDTDLFDDLSNVLESDKVKTVADIESSDAVEHLSAFYGYDKTVKIVHGDLIEGVASEEETVARMLNPEKLKQEWPRLKGMMNGSYTNLSPAHLCRRIILLHSDILPNFSKDCFVYAAYKC